MQHGLAGVNVVVVLEVDWVVCQEEVCHEVVHREEVHHEVVEGLDPWVVALVLGRLSHQLCAV